ncbi:NADH-ubiquinone oxidoreductase-F iron-sulfur binding region domain-containing protein [Halopelagius longus]|uniref:NADH dehydrogenase FAD-containing subunit n=1 Tax=Halopelagius longus TaxID=1236180 RepID=A0A1H1DIX5_9EURY|nr:NADH-ubiquinone oxidoreductase-F iron-sulfur binding region domain-containing protein [Halopelagius longus]RDI71344.1 NADH dehydrogenase FAD-containing subunit [Halopelagius longus]SDQ76189.1 NADH dehydrogenase subunit F [Halopelagius longus]
MSTTGSGDGPTVRVTVGSHGHRDEPEEERRVSAATAVLDGARDAATDVTVVETGPTGADRWEPLVLCTLDGRTAYHPSCDGSRAKRLVETLESGSLPTDGAAAVVEHGDSPDSLPTPEDGPLSVGRRRVLARCGWAAADDAPDPVPVADAESVHERVAEVGLLGRGRGDAHRDEPIADAWETAREEDGDPVVVVNANDRDPRSHADPLLLESDPASVVEAAALTADAVGATDVVVYTTADEFLRRRVREAVDALIEEDRLDARPQVVAGPDRYIAGEPTIALEALEGSDRIEARLTPPSPAVHGLYGRPTLVHTPRTFAQVRLALSNPEAFDPDDADPGTRLVSVTGDVDSPATVELPTGGSMSAVRDAVEFEGSPKMAVVGGQFGGFTTHLDHTISSPALDAANLGTEGIVELFDEDKCPVATAGKRARFAQDENCGRCAPCREGTKQLVNLLREVYDGDYDDDMIRELARTMRATSTCGFGRSAGRTVDTAMNAFETEFRVHADGRCPAGECQVASREVNR